MDKLPFVKGNLHLCLGVLHPTQTPDVVLFETTHTPVSGFTLNRECEFGRSVCVPDRPTGALGPPTRVRPQHPTRFPGRLLQVGV